MSTCLLSAGKFRRNLTRLQNDELGLFKMYLRMIYSDYRGFRRKIKISKFSVKFDEIIPAGLEKPSIILLSLK